MSGLTRREMLRRSGLVGLGLTAVLAGCQPKVVEVTKVVKEKEIVKETVVVTQEKEVEKIVRQTVVVEKVKDQILLRWHHRLGTEWKMYQSAREAFKERRPDVRINEEVIPATGVEYGPKMLSIIAGGVAGDICWMANGTGSFQFFAANKALTALDEFVNADKSFSLDGYFPRAVEMFRLGDGGVGTGSLWALPELAQAYPVFLFYNKDICDAEGIKPTDDWTRDDMLEAAKKLTKGDRYGFLPVWNNLLLMRHHTLPYGLEPISDDGKKSRINEPQVKEVLRWLIDLYNKHKVAPRAQDIQGDTSQMFLGKKLVMLQGAIPSFFTYQTMVKDQFKWEMILMPKGPSGSRGQHLSGDGEGILAQSKNKQVAWEFIKLVTDDERQLLLLKEIGLSSRPSAFEHASTKDLPHFKRCYQMINTAARYLCPANFRQQEINTVINATFAPAINGEKPADDAFFAAASKAIQDVLDKPKE